MKLELKHLAPYLPYGLEIYEPIKEYNLKLDPCMTTYTTQKIGLPFLFEHGRYKIEHGLPILRPLSDLSNSGGLDCFNELCENCYDIDENLDYLCEYKGDLTKTSLSFRAVQILFMWHFDVFGLIPKGLAIDINTI